MEENNISIFNNEVEPVELRLGSIPDVPLVKFNPPESDYEKNRRDRDKEISIFNAPDPVNNFSITENMGKISNTPTYATGTSRSVDDLSELSDYDVLTGESPYGSGKDDYMYRHQSTMEALGKTAWNAMPNLISGLTMTPSAAYSIADRNFGTDNPYENPLSAVSDWAQEKKYRVWGKDGQLDLSDALGIIEQIPMTLGIMGGTVATLAPAAFVGAELGLGAVAGTSLGFGVTVGEVGSAIAMAYAEGRDGARGTFKDKYNQIYKETGNDEYAKRIAETAASVETNTNILLNTALNIIPAKWLLKNNKLKAIDDVLEDTGLLNKFKPYQLADESLEEFTDRMRSFTPGTKTNLNRSVLDYAGKWSDLVYNVKNPGELLNRKLDIVGEIFGEGLEEYNNYYAHELAMSINNEKDVQKLNGVLSVPLSQIGSDITNVKMLKDMANNKGLYDFASGAIVSALTSPFMKKFKLNRSKVYNEETGEYDYKYKRGDSNPFKNIPYFEYQNSDYDALDVEQQALNSLKTINQMNNLVASYNDATDMDIKDGFIQQITNIPLSKHLNQKTINVYNALLDNQIKGLGEKNKSIVNDDTLIETVSKGLDTSMYSYITAQDKTKLEDRVTKYKNVSALIAANAANGLDVRKEEAEKTGYLKEIKDIGSVASKAINKHQAELKTQLDYSKNLAKDYNETIEYFTKQGVTRDNDYGFVNAYFLNKINNKEESKLHDKILQKYNTLQKEITDELVKNDTDGYKTKQAAYELLKKKEETLSDEIDKKEKEVAKLISRSDPNDSIYIDTLTNEIDAAKAELTDLRTKDADGKTNIEKLVMSALKELSGIQSKALSGNAQLMDYGDNLTKSRIRLRQYEIENKHLTDSSYGDETDTILQKLHMKIQAHRNGDNLLSAISKYEQISKFLETNGITTDPLEFGVFTDDEKETLRRHRQFNEYVLEYEKILDTNKGKEQGHYLSKYFKANKRFVDELEKYEKSKEEVQFYHRQLYRLSETDDINYYAEFMSIFSNLQKYVNEEGNIYNLDKDSMKEAIDNYNRYYQNALNYIDELEQHYKDLEISDGVNRKMFTDRTENLKYLIMSKTKEIERLSEMYNYKLAQDTNKELSDLYKTIRSNYTSGMDIATRRNAIELQLFSYKRYISNYDKVVEMLVNNIDKSDYYDKKAVDSTKYYHKYGVYDISIDKVMEYSTTTNKFEEKEVYLVNGAETKLTLIKIDATGQLLFANQNNPLLSDELKAIKTKDIVPNDYLFTDVDGNEIKYINLKDFESIEEKLGNTPVTKLINIDGDIYYKDVTADIYKIVDNKGELVLLNDIISKYPVDAPFQLHVPVKGVFLIDNQIYTSNGDTLERNPDTQFYSITDKTSGDIKIFTIKSINDDKLTIEVSYGNDSIREEIISFNQDIIPTPSKADTDYVKSMVAFIDDYVDATGKFDYAKYKSENEIDTIHKVIINLIDELISQNKKSNFYLHTISNRLVSPFIDIIRNSKLSSLIDLVHNDINKDYPNDIDFTDTVKKTGRLLFNQELKESNYKTKIGDYINTINFDSTKKDTQLLDNVLAGITAKLGALKNSVWKKDMVYDLYQILKEYNELVNDTANLKVSYKFEDKRDINVNTTINLTEDGKIVSYKYASHKYVLTDTGLKVEVMYTIDGKDADLNDSTVVQNINNGSVRPIILTLNVGKDLKTTPETLKRVTVDKDMIAFNNLTETNLQNGHSFDLFTNNKSSKVLKVSGKQISVNNTINPTLFDSSSYNQDRTAISRDNMIQLKRLIALFSTDTNGNPIDVYKDIFRGIINDAIIIGFINKVFGSMDVFQRIAINADKVTFTRKITANNIIDTVNDVVHSYVIEKPIINTGTSGSNIIMPEEIIPKSLLEIEKDKITSNEFIELVRLAKYFLANPKEPTVIGSVVSKYPELFKEITKIEKERQRQLSDLGVKQIAAAFDALREAKTPVEKLNAINTIERNVIAGAIITKSEQQEIQRIKDNLSADGYDVPKLLGRQFHQGLKVIVLSSIPDENLEYGIEIISKVIIPAVNYNDNMIQTAQIQITVGTKKGGITKEQWLSEQKEKEYLPNNINAKYDKLIEDLYNNQPKETDEGIDKSIIDTNNEFLNLQKEIDSILEVNNELRVKTIDKINTIEKVLGFGLNIDEENTLFAVEYIVDNNTWKISDKEPEEIVGMYEKDNWEIIMSIYNAYKTKIKPNKVKIANIEKEKFNLLSTLTGLELRRAWSLGKVEEPTMLQLTADDYIEKTSTDGKDIYTGYYYSLGKGKINLKTIEPVKGDSIQEVIAKLNAKYDEELADIISSNQSEIEGQVGTSNYSVINGLIFYNNPDTSLVPVPNPKKEDVLIVIEADIKRRKEIELSDLKKIDLKKVAEVIVYNYGRDFNIGSFYNVDENKHEVSGHFTFKDNIDPFEDWDEDYRRSVKEELEKFQKFIRKYYTVNDKRNIHSHNSYNDYSFKGGDSLQIDTIYGEKALFNFHILINAKYGAETEALKKLEESTINDNTKQPPLSPIDTLKAEIKAKKPEKDKKRIDLLNKSIIYTNGYYLYVESFEGYDGTIHNHIIKDKENNIIWSLYENYRFLMEKRIYEDIKEGRSKVKLTEQETKELWKNHYKNTEIVKKVEEELNTIDDEEYLEAVNTKRITKIEALQALISVRRKNSDTYNKLLKDLVEEKISEAIADKGENIRYFIKNNDKIIPADNLNEIDIAFDITIDVTVLPPVDLSIPDEFDMLLEAPYEYISEALLNRDFPTVADNSNHHKESRHSSVLNTNTEIDHTVPIGKNYTISHSDEDKKAYKEGLHEKLHNNTGIKNVTLEVMPISVSYHENGNLITKKLSTKKEQYDFYYEVFSKLGETPALKGYIESMGYNLLDNILDSNNKPLFDFKFSDISTNKEKIISFLADLKINYVFMNADKSKIYGSLHDYAYLLAKGIRVETISDSAISSLKILRDTAKQHENNLNNSVSSDKPIYNLSYLDNGYIRIFKDFSINPPPLTERRNLYYNSKIALARQDTETFKIYLNKTNSGASGVLKYNQDTLDTTIANMNEEELRSIYRLLLYKANRVLKLNIPPIPPGTDIDSNELTTWIEDVLTPKISGNFIIYGAKITNNISKESTHIPLYTIKFKQLLPSINLTIDNNFVDDNGEVIRSIKETNKEIEEYHNKLSAAINNINLTEIGDVVADRKNMLEILGNFAHIEIESKDVKDWVRKLAKVNDNGKSFEGTSIAVYNNNNTSELTLYLYSNIKNEKGEDVKTITSISYKSSKKPLIKNSIYLSTSDDFIDTNSFTLQPDKLLEKFMNAYLSVDVTANNADKNILLRTITHVNGLNDEIFVNPLLQIEDTQRTKTVTPIVVATDNTNTPNTTLPKELIAIQGLIDLYEEFITEEKRKDKSYLISGLKTIIKPYNEVTGKVDIVYELIINNSDIKILMSKYKSFVNNIINKGDTIDVTTIPNISNLKLFVKKDDIYYINAKYNDNTLNEDIETLKGLEIDKKIQDCK